MKNWKTWIPLLVVPALLVLVGGAGLMMAESASLVEWGTLRAVVFESDDWGLAGFVPFAEVWRGVDREELKPGGFPAVYWESTLEDSQMVDQLCNIMASVSGSDGLPAVFQPNYVLSSLSYEAGPEGFTWNRYDWPEVPPVYSRPGLERAVRSGINKGLWYPEFHATWHYDPAMRLESALSTDLSRKMTKAGVTLFPGSEKARELGPWRSTDDLTFELTKSRQIFEKAFGRPIGAVIAPDYTWDKRLESLWQSQGIRVIQAKREQRDPTLVSGKLGRIMKYALRKLDLLGNRQRTYLNRNCRLEPVQAPDAEAVVEICLAETRRAWSENRPAIVETHRINFVHCDPEVVRKGQDALQSYLNSICDDPASLPLFLVDSEIAQLQTRGVSWVARGDKLILRNATHSRRLIIVSRNHAKRVYALTANSIHVTNW